MGRPEVPELVSLSVSAWSLKARFALKYHAIRYRTTPYMPLIGEFTLRLRLWEWKRKLTVPVMFTPKDGVLMQSYDIAKWADSHSARPEAHSLFPPGAEDQVAAWNAKSDTVIYFGRSALMDSLLANPAELAKQVPSSMRWAGPLGFLFTRAVVVRLRGKYQAEGSSTSLDKVLGVLRELQAALKRSGGDYLVGGKLSYADIAMAVAVQVVKPLQPPFATLARLPLEVLQPYQEEFRDLTEWRDRIFTKHFPLDDKKTKAV